MKNTDKIKEKIKALLSKTIDNGATKSEMESALLKANQLMTEFFISEHDLKDETIISKCKSESFPIVKSGFDISIFYADLAFLFECEHYYNSKTITFFGHETDVAMCGYFYNVIAKTVLKEKAKYLKSENYKFLSRFNHGRSLSANFIKGFLIEVVYKMKAMYKERQSNIPESFGLMVLNKKEKVKFEFQELDLDIKRQKAKEINAENEAFNDGSEIGKRLQLIQGIDENNELNKLRLQF